MKNVILLSTVLSSIVFAAGPVYKTGQNGSYYSHDDGDYKSGLNPSFISLNDGDIIKDTRLNLLWQNDKKLDAGGDNTWEDKDYSDAVKYCEELGLDNKIWRLPTRLEAKTIFTFSESFPYIQDAFKDTVAFDERYSVEGHTESTKVLRFWTSTISKENETKAWVVDELNGVDFEPEDMMTVLHNVRCVSNDSQIKTSYTDNKDSTITDNISKLTWQNTSPESKTWESAIDYCESSTLAGYKDWRLPNATELYFLTDDAEFNPAIATPFKNNTKVKNGDNEIGYWTSTTVKGNTQYAITIRFMYGENWASNKGNNRLVRCVRGGMSSQDSLPSIINFLLD